MIITVRDEPLRIISGDPCHLAQSRAKSPGGRSGRFLEAALEKASSTPLLSVRGVLDIGLHLHPSTGAQCPVDTETYKR